MASPMKPAEEWILQDVCAPILISCTHVPLHGTKDFTDTPLRMLRGRDYPGGPNEITRVLIRETGRRVNVMEGDVITEAEKQDGKMLSPSPSSYCSLHDRPIIKRRAVGAMDRDFIQNVNTLRRWWTHAPKDHLA